MPYGFSLNTLPIWTAASFMRFGENDRPATRICRYDVLILVFEGTFRMSVNGDPIELKAGEYYLIHHGSREAGDLPCDSPYYFYFHFKENLFDCPNILPQRGRFDTNELLPVLRELEALIRSRANKVAKASVIYKVLATLKKQNPSKTHQVSVIVDRAVRKDIKKHYSAEELARLCGYSKNYFIQAFKKETGKTPHAYITEIRISAAKELVLSDLSLEAAAKECGFSEYTNFYRAFKSSVGVSPRSWKEKHTKKT